VSPGYCFRFCIGSHNDIAYQDDASGVWCGSGDSQGSVVRIFCRNRSACSRTARGWRGGSGIGAVLTNMRTTEQIDAVEALSIDSIKLLIVPRIAACVVALPLLTMFMDFAGLIGGSCSAVRWAAPLAREAGVICISRLKQVHSTLPTVGVSVDKFDTQRPSRPASRVTSDLYSTA
jgi:hypothetical protein